MPVPDLTAAKIAAAHAAVALVQPGMRVGLGTGSTVHYFLELLGRRCQDGLAISTLASSRATEAKARALGIPLAAEESTVVLDLTVDGADEVDPSKRLIKGGGGALLREKILAYMATEMVVIVDDSKLSPHLGKAPLPVEVTPFAHTATQHHLQRHGFPSKLRYKSDGSLFITDNDNYILDVKLPFPCTDPEAIDLRLRTIPGVLETGFFFNLAHRIIVGHADGTWTLD